MDWLGVAAVIAAVSGLVVSATGIVVAFRVVTPAAGSKAKVEGPLPQSEPLPLGSPTPGEPIALEPVCFFISHATKGFDRRAGERAWRFGRWIVARRSI